MNILFYMNSADKPYLPRLKKHMGAHNVWLFNSFSMLIELSMKAKEKRAEWIVTTRYDILEALCKYEGYDSRKGISIYDYVGSVFEYKGIKILIQAPLETLIKAADGEFIFARMISKITRPKDWFQTTQFNWCLGTPDKLETLYTEFQAAYAIVVDIETLPEDKVMTEVGYTGVFWNETTRNFTISSFTIPLDGGYALSWIRKFNKLPAQKILQNGKYDLAYLLRYDCLFDNYLWDTINLFHSYYAELPKDLGFQSAWFIRDFKYWKHESSSTDALAKYKYNGKDTWVTANVWLATIAEMPDWAVDNYLLEFPIVAPDFYIECLGIKADAGQLLKVKEKKKKELEADLASLRRMTSSGFNPNSPKQVTELLQALGHSTLTNSDATALAAVSYLDPLAAVIIEKITNCRELSKAITTYLNEDKLYSGGIDGKSTARPPRILYAVNPHGTESARNASKAHHLGAKGAPVGLQIQNITRSESDDEDDNIKSYFVADAGFLIGEADYAQAESRDTGYISGDCTLIEAVTGPRDFHGVNASCFFGLPYESIIDTKVDEATGKSVHKVLNKPIRQLAKPVNHGANYNMGEHVLIATMGLKKIFEAARMLLLPPGMSAKGIASHLLDSFAKTYKVVKVDYQEWIKTQVAAFKRLTSAPMPNGRQWTRYCFMDPSKNKQALNAYVAHCPQNLNALTLNQAFKKVFYEVQIPNPETFRLNAQIHDSILFQYKEGYEKHIAEVKACMEFTVEVTDIFGIKRALLVPVDVKGGKKSWG